MSIAIRIKDCIDNYDKYVALMATLPDKELATKLNLVHIQSEIACKTNNVGSLELLEIWRTQIIDARIYKMENNIADAPNEIKEAIADIETFVSKTEGREELLNNFSEHVKKNHSKNQQQNDDSQLSLF
jgi:hypothetical protein